VASGYKTKADVEIMGGGGEGDRVQKAERWAILQTRTSHARVDSAFNGDANRRSVVGAAVGAGLAPCFASSLRLRASATLTADRVVATAML
jgi:hypothetical protein